MLRERTELVFNVVSRLEPAERHMDQALAALAELNGYLPRARGPAGLALEVASGPIAAFGEAQALIMQAYGKVAEGHRQLAAIQKDFRFPKLADGGLGNKDPNPHPFAPLPATAASAFAEPAHFTVDRAELQ